MYKKSNNYRKKNYKNNRSYYKPKKRIKLPYTITKSKFKDSFKLNDALGKDGKIHLKKWYKKAKTRRKIQKVKYKNTLRHNFNVIFNNSMFGKIYTWKTKKKMGIKRKTQNKNIKIEKGVMKNFKKYNIKI